MDNQAVAQLITAIAQGLVDDMGRVIGKQGRIAKAIRTVVRAAANKVGAKAAVEID